VYKKAIIFVVFLTFCLSAVWAGGRKENNASYTADDPSGFTDSIDINNKKTGKWNYYLEATDKGGNIALSGPENIFIDPVSDLPLVTIINPIPNMRVQGNLNIVGIAMDDDAVDQVWFTVTRGRDGNGEELVNAQASGTDYWSYFLNTTDPDIWTDGVYTITAWAIDINGLSGVSDDFPAKVHKKHQVYWHLDRKKPDTVVTSHEVGALVSGKVKLGGTVTDGNGINALSYSIDGGNRYMPVRVKKDRSNNYTWDLNLDTPKLFEDGPAVIWFQALDGQGSLGTAAHLLFVNNIAPDVEVVYPEANATVNGIFSIAGFASHPVGVKRVTWSAGRQNGEFEMIPGNAWWSADIDIRNIKTTSVDIEIRAEDVSGNVSVKKQRYRVDQNADMPVITLYEPVTGAIAHDDGNIVVKGVAADDDGVASVFYALNGGTPVEIPCSGYFQFMIPGLVEGANFIEIWGKDIAGVMGNKVAVRNINSPGPLVEPRITTLSTGIGSAAVVQSFYTGVTLRMDQRNRTSMEVAVKASALSAASVVFEGQPAIVIRPAAGRDGYMRATLLVPQNLKSGFVRVELHATDRFGREVVYPEYMFVENASGAPASDYSTDTTDYRTQAMGTGNSSFTWVRENFTDDGRILLKSPDEVLVGVANTRLTNVSVSGNGANNVNVQIDQNGMVVLNALQEGTFGPLTLRLDDQNYQTFTSQAFRIIADFRDPVITLQNVPQGQWIQFNAPVTFNVTSPNRVTAVEYSLDMGENWLSMLASGDLSSIRAPTNQNVSRTLNIGEANDGSIMVLLRATSESGRAAVSGFTVLKDNEAPNVSLAMPVIDARVNGTIRMAFDIAEKGSLKSVVYRSGSITKEVFNINLIEQDYEPRFLEVLMDSIEMPLANNMRFIFEDMAGNRTEVGSWPFIIDQEMDIPIAHIILPLDNEVITTDFIVSGIMFDDDKIKNIQWRIDNNAMQTVDAENGFSIPISLSTLTDNEHSVTVIAEDIYGVRSAPVTRGFRVSLAEPAGAVTYPQFDTVLRESVEIRGTASDRNGIQKIMVSVDNGNSFNLARGTTSWTYEFNTKILKDGPHVVFFRVHDNYDITATYATMINVDNTPPEIILDSPGDGSMSTGNVLVMGRTLDPNLSDVRVEMRSLDGTQIRGDLRTRNIGDEEVIKEAYDLTGMRDGIYNIEVVATDSAGNVTRVSRNVQLARETFKNFVEILYPLDNENLQGVFNLYGYAGGTDLPGTVTIRINGNDVIENEVDDSGYFRFSLSGEYLNEGTNSIMAYSNFGGRTAIQSRTQNLVYKSDGPWVTIDSLTFGDFAYERPYLAGRVGYELTEEEQALLADKDTDKAVKAALLAKTPAFTEISFDNGKTFKRTLVALAKDIDYRYRLETGEMIEGLHYILVRTTMKNSETAITRMIVQVDKTKPVIRLISPEAGGIYNQELVYSASATDDVELVSLTYHLRIGDKNAYEIPGFLQGLYFESIIPPIIKLANNNAPNLPFGGGATFMDVSFGLSFFDDNVKIQGLYGFMTQDIYEKLGGQGLVRYGGNVLGVKLLANVYTLPLGAVWGPDFEWLYASFGIGANFSLFDVSQQGYTQSGKRTWMSSLLLQIEFPKVTIPKRKNFRTFSLFTEGALWFVPTDVDAEALGIETVIPKVTMGLRLYIF
jgi:hypothetical protein